MSGSIQTVGITGGTITGVTGDLTTASVSILGTGTNLTISVTALGAVQVTHTAGTDQTVQWVYQLMGA